MEIESKKVTVQSSDETIFKLLINCNNIAKYIPNDKIQNWQSTQDSCSFVIEGAGKIEMSIEGKTPYSSASYSIGSALTKSVLVVFSIDKAEREENLCQLQAKADLDVPFFMANMVKPTIQRFIDMIIEHIKIVAEDSNK
jgi:hypothetical protein